MKPALLIIDMNNDCFAFHNGILEHNRKKLVENINALATTMRERGFPIFWTTQRFDTIDEAPLPIRKTGKLRYDSKGDGWKLLDELDYRQDEPLIIKPRYSALDRTDLLQQLKDNGIDTVIVAGVNGHSCVFKTAWDLSDHDFEVIWAHECIGSSLPQFTDAMESFITGERNKHTTQLAKYASNDEIIAMLQ